MLAALLGLAVLSCKEEVNTPKPRGYFKIDLPERTNPANVQLAGCSYQFQYPANAKVERDSLFFNQEPDDPCWMDIVYPSINGRVHISYKSLQKHDLTELTEDYHKIKFKHSVKADFIDDVVIVNQDKKVYGLASDVGGDVASAYQFYLTDSSEHYVRGAVYFTSVVNADSLAPVVNYVKQDIQTLFDSWKWD